MRTMCLKQGFPVNSDEEDGGDEMPPLVSDEEDENAQCGAGSGL